jgi:hypothetical protein
MISPYTRPFIRNYKSLKVRSDNLPAFTQRLSPN